MLVGVYSPTLSLRVGVYSPTTRLSSALVVNLIA
jgi:hypothetical protein